jgi:hypothetical protein
MIITSAKNHNSPTTGEIVNIKATIDGTEMFVPIDPANRHYAEIHATGRRRYLDHR